MKKIALAALVAAVPVSMMAQSAISAYELSQSDLRGTARFMSMAGAFGALGGDLSTLNQNPAGIGVYRSSEIGVTVDFNMASSDAAGSKWNKTHVYCNNFGYIGSINTNNEVMPYFQWGATYSRSASFDRNFRGRIDNLGTSMSNYVANFTNASPSTLGQSTSYDPYTQSSADWLSILAYNSYLINPIGNSSTYQGLYDESTTTGNSEFRVQERGYIDEYSINFGGNFVNTVYWGMGFGITDLSYTQNAFYDEELQNASIATATGNSGSVENGNAYYALSNYKHVSGTGFNYKIGAIYKPINELRFGLAFHTPTWYTLSESYDSNVQYSYASKAGEGTAYSGLAYYDWRLKTPWKMIVSAAGVIGGRFILSADYEYGGTKSMTVSDDDNNEYVDVSDDIDYYFKPTNTFRIGAEYRITPQFSVRAGFATTSSGVEKSVIDGDEYVYTSGTNPAYTLNNNTYYYTAGVGYRAGGFYADLAYVNKHRSSVYTPFSSFDDGGWVYNPYCDVKTNNNNIVLSVGYKF